MREHVVVNSRCARVRSLQYFQTWQIIVLIFLWALASMVWRKRRNFKLLFVLRRKVELYLLPSTHCEWESFFCRFLQMLSTAAHSRPHSPLGHVVLKRGAGSLQIKPSGSGDENDSGHDRGECCLSAVCFALLTCWHVQFSKTFAFLFFSP